MQKYVWAIAGGLLAVSTGCSGAGTTANPSMSMQQQTIVNRGGQSAPAGAWTIEKPLPMPLAGAAAVYDGFNFPVLFGGESAQKHAQRNTLYEGDFFNWTKAPPLLHARSLLAAAWTGGYFGNRLYAIGGIDNGKVVGTLEALNEDKNQRYELPPMPTPRYALGADGNFGSAAIAIGGADSQGNALNTAEAFNAADRTWRELAPMPTARYGLSVVSENGARGLHVVIFAIGGKNASGVLNTVEAYDPKTNRWKTVAPMPTARYFAGAAQSNIPNTPGFIVAGGIDAKGNVLNTVEEYDAVHNTWTTLPPLHIARYQIAAVQDMNGDVLAIGGIDASGKVSDAVEAYNPLSTPAPAR